MLPIHDSLLIDITAIAMGNQARRTEVEAAMERMEARGWHVREPVLRIWAGERDLAALTAGLDEADARFIGDVLEALDAAPPDSQELFAAEALLAGLPAPLRQAVLERDASAFLAALQSLPASQAETTLAQLQQAGLMGDSDIDAVYDLEPLLLAAAAAARGDAAQRQQAEALLSDVGGASPELLHAIRQIWDGERNLPALAGQRSPAEQEIIRRLLELL